MSVYKVYITIKKSQWPFGPNIGKTLTCWGVNQFRVELAYNIRSSYELLAISYTRKNTLN